LLVSAQLLAQISAGPGNSSNPPAANPSPANNPVSFPSLNSSSASAPAPAAGSATAADIHDIHSLAPLTFWERHGTEIIIYSILGLALLALVLWLLLRKKTTPPLTPYERALQDLLFARGLQDTGQDKAFAIAASDAVRRYLESAYHVPAPERTTEEFLQVAAHQVWMQGELTTLLRRFLEFCDLAKFAGQQFGAEEREQLLKSAREFIDAAEKLRQPASTTTAPNPAPAAPPPAKTPAEPTLSAP
jgi:LPXTG-motif cell wall-anchored protein